MSFGMKIGIDVAHLHASPYCMTSRDSDDLLRNITAAGKSWSAFSPPFLPLPLYTPAYSSIYIALLRAYVCMYFICVCVCVFSIPRVLVLTFLFLPYRSVHIARVMSIESVTLKNPLTRLRDRSYNSVTVIFRGPSIDSGTLEISRAIFCFLCISIVFVWSRKRLSPPKKVHCFLFNLLIPRYFCYKNIESRLYQKL